ncbi:YceI family protein [Desulfovibrio sp. X2]|uniref:YceI family protein n=1 Tax=Desulfovibrio sp. X2 TaxID=941449 RepID=UPI000358CC43|nr:YceI family protein [Desulfovibrio sp. X2]EPR37488.1 YceI family protein [Desulfovibrio sp. X2]
MSPSTTFVPARQLAERLAAEPKLPVLCLLPPEVHAAKRLPGAACTCVYEVIFPQLVAKAAPDPARTVAVYGAGEGSRDSHAAAAKLAALGYGDVLVLEGGIEAWERAGLPLEGGAAAVPLVDAAVLQPVPGTYRLRPGECSLEWVGRNRKNRHHGSAAIESGELVFEPETMRGTVRVDMTSLRNHDLEDPELNTLLVTHLSSEDFFLTALFPKARLEITDTVPLPSATPGTPNRQVHARLELRGVTRPLCFPATFARTDEGLLTAEAHFDLDRTLWGADYGSGRLYRFLGYHLVYDDVSVSVSLNAELVTP